MVRAKRTNVGYHSSESQENVQLERKTKPQSLNEEFEDMLLSMVPLENDDRAQ